MKNRILPFIAVACSLSLTQTVASLVVIVDTFSGPLTSDIEGRVPDTVQSFGDAWSRSNADSARTEVGGGILYMSETQKGFSKAALEFDRSIGLVASNPYTLSFSIAFNPGTDTSVQWYGGFGNAGDAGGTFTDFAGGPMFNLTGDTTGTSFTLRAGISPFASSITTTLSRANTSIPYTADLAIQVDPLAATDNVEYFVNGGSLGTISYSGNIGGIWFKTDSWDNTTTTGIRISNFQLTAVPEPSSLGLLLGLGILVVLGFSPRVRVKA